MARESVTLDVGGRKLVIKPLTLGQVRAICEVMESSNLLAGPTALKNVDFSIKVINIGIGGDYPELRAEDLAIGFDQFDAISTAIMRQGGFAAPGEAPAAAPNASTGATSGAGSQRHSEKRQRR